MKATAAQTTPTAARGFSASPGCAQRRLRAAAPGRAPIAQIVAPLHRIAWEARRPPRRRASPIRTKEAAATGCTEGLDCNASYPYCWAVSTGSATQKTCNYQAGPGNAFCKDPNDCLSQSCVSGRCAIQCAATGVSCSSRNDCCSTYPIVGGRLLLTRPARRAKLRLHTTAQNPPTAALPIRIVTEMPRRIAPAKPDRVWLARTAVRPTTARRVHATTVNAQEPRHAPEAHHAHLRQTAAKATLLLLRNVDGRQNVFLIGRKRRSILRIHLGLRIWLLLRGKHRFAVNQNVFVLEGRRHCGLHSQFGLHLWNMQLRLLHRPVYLFHINIMHLARRLLQHLPELRRDPRRRPSNIALHPGPALAPVRAIWIVTPPATTAVERQHPLPSKRATTAKALQVLCARATSIAHPELVPAESASDPRTARLDRSPSRSR